MASLLAGALFQRIHEDILNNIVLNAIPRPHQPEPETRRTNKCKIVLNGASGAGKTSLIFRFTENSFQENLGVTIRPDIKRKKINIDGDEIMLEIWDTAGQERFNACIRSFYRDVQGGILVYDVNDRNSFKILDFWLNELELNCLDMNVQKMIIGNKIDQDGRRQVSREEALKYAKDRGVLYMETSARTSTGAKEAFETIARKIIAAGNTESNSNSDDTINIGSHNTTNNYNMNVSDNQCGC